MALQALFTTFVPAALETASGGLKLLGAVRGSGADSAIATVAPLLSKASVALPVGIHAVGIAQSGASVAAFASAAAEAIAFQQSQVNQLADYACAASEAVDWFVSEATAAESSTAHNFAGLGR